MGPVGPKRGAAGVADADAAAGPEVCGRRVGRPGGPTRTFTISRSPFPSSLDTGRSVSDGGRKEGESVILVIKMVGLQVVP